MKRYAGPVALVIAVFLLLGTFVMTTSCSAYKAKFGALGDPARVSLVSGGRIVKVWCSTGKVMSSSQSDGYYFNDLETGRLIEVSGSVIIESDHPRCQE